MEDNIKKILRIFVAVAVGMLLFFGIQKIVIPRFSSTEIVDGFYQEEKDSIDVLFVGSSNMFCTIDPVTLYEEEGIASYDFGSSLQSLNLSLLYIKEALKYQTPKVIGLEVLTSSNDYYQQLKEEAMRWGFTNLRFSVEKCSTLYDELGKIDFEYLSYIFPFFRYKDRWKELNADDIEYLRSDKQNYNKGFYYTNEVSEKPVNHTVYTRETEFTLAESNSRILKEIASLCQEHGIQLFFFKSPTAKTWTKTMSQAIRGLADSIDVPFLEMNDFMEEMEIQYDTDFRDESHLNYKGAKKASSYMAAYLKENYEIPDRRGSDNSWDEALQRRQNQIKKEEIQETEAMEEYFQLLQDCPFLCVITSNGLSEEPEGIIDGLPGLSWEKVSQGGCWILSDGEVEQEFSGDSYSYHEDLGEVTLTVSSAVKAEGQQEKRVLLRKNNYFNISRGIHVLIYDLESQEVVDSIGFDADQEWKGIRA
ncbi:MAG: hypothetical protein SOZ59_07230 [Candidatus Limivivens sp.]|nr:hypothetical protein [Candidatus Limivivens sp.]